MSFLIDYFEAIDIIALVALLGLAAVAFFTTRRYLGGDPLCRRRLLGGGPDFQHPLAASFLSAQRTRLATFPRSIE